MVVEENHIEIKQFVNSSRDHVTKDPNVVAQHAKFNSEYMSVISKDTKTKSDEYESNKTNHE